MKVYMKYVIDSRYRLRGWHGAPSGIYDTRKKSAVFVDQGLYKLLIRCDGSQEIDPTCLSKQEQEFLHALLKEKIIRPAGFWDVLLPEQRYHAYPARYRKSAHWSITGTCNMRCRHCFISAPHAKHGSPNHAEIMDIVDQLAECGVYSVAITGGEPLIREDFLDIVEALNRHEITLTTIYTNGWLLDEAFLDSLEKKGVRPSFQLSFDGIGWHDFLRGVPGAEEKTITALKLLQKRNYSVSISMCLHQKNKSVLRESVLLLASLGVKSLKCSSMMELGEWASEQTVSLRLAKQEEFALFEEYIPQYFADDAPLSIALSGAFAYNKGSHDWMIGYLRKCPRDQENRQPACPVLKDSFYIGADGLVAPCQGMGDCNFSKNLPSLKEMPLHQILTDSTYVHYSYATVGDVRQGNNACLKCDYIDRCAGSCRNSALITSNNYYGVDPDACLFFQNGWEDRIKTAAQPAFEEYIRRNPPTKDTGNDLPCL